MGTIRRTAPIALLGLALLAVPAIAHDASWTGSIMGLGAGVAVPVTHQDATPFKGYMSINVTNNGPAAWGDFHFGFYDPIGGQDITNLAFLDSATTPVGPSPTSTQAPLSWIINNTVVGATCDLYFYSNPVLPGQTANFTVYTGNPDHLSWFGVMIYPTPVPEPAACALLGLALLMRRR
jgi:hypothetical protein